MIRLSERMSHLAVLVSEGMVLCDVGTDHGYLPIWLLQAGRIPKAYAMDIGEGPLERAKEHIRQCGLEAYIETRRCDGLAGLMPKEADSILIAGMGGGVMLHILKDGDAVVRQAEELILQPQSEIAEVRKYLYEQGFEIDREDIVEEDGKYYPMMHVRVHTKQEQGVPDEVSLFYGADLLAQKHPVLLEYVNRTVAQLQGILRQLQKAEQTDAVLTRIGEIQKELTMAQAAQERCKEEKNHEMQ